MIEMTEVDYRLLFNAVDTDHSGSIDFREFQRKLERHGAVNYGKE